MGTRHIDRFWSAKLGLEPAALYQSGIYVVPNVLQWDDSFAYVFVRGSTCVLSVGPTLVEVMRERTRNTEPRLLLDEARLQTIFDRRIERTVGPAYQGYAELTDFSACQSERVRKVRSDESQLLDRFKDACEAIAWEHSAIDKTSSDLFGYFTEDGLLAIGHYSKWGSDLASIGVLTHPAYRCRGYGKFVVSAAMSDAFEHGCVILYQTLIANKPSVSLATTLGCRDYARTVAVHLIK